MAYSSVNYVGDGSNRTFAVPFSYLSQSHVSVTVNGSSASFSWPTGSTVTLASAPASGAAVAIQRLTPIANPSVVFTDGGTLTASDLNSSALQDLYAAQERYDADNLFWSETLVVASTDAIGPLTKTPNLRFMILTVQGQSFLLPSGAFSVSGKNLTWNDAVAQYAIPAGASVEVSYTYNTGT